MYTLSPSTSGDLEKMAADPTTDLMQRQRAKFLERKRKDENDHQDERQALKVVDSL